MTRHLRAPVSLLMGETEVKPAELVALPLCGAPNVPPGELTNDEKLSDCSECKAKEKRGRAGDTGP
jgi:hypothetical protein